VRIWRFCTNGALVARRTPTSDTHRQRRAIPRVRRQYQSRSITAGIRRKTPIRSARPSASDRPPSPSRYPNVHAVDLLAGRASWRHTSQHARADRPAAYRVALGMPRVASIARFGEVNVNLHVRGRSAHRERPALAPWMATSGPYEPSRAQPLPGIPLARPPSVPGGSRAWCRSRCAARFRHPAGRTKHLQRHAQTAQHARSCSGRALGTFRYPIRIGLAGWHGAAQSTPLQLRDIRIR